MQSNGLNIQDVSLKSFSVDMVTFYLEVVRKSLAAANATADKKTSNHLRNKYTKKLRKDSPCTISFDGVETRCAYVYQFCPSFTLAAASQFLSFLKNSPQYIENLALRESLSVCCLGGGPATEVVAICGVLAEVRKRWSGQNGMPLLIDVTVVDSENGWSATAKDIVDNLSSLVPQSMVKINRFRFVQADLTRDMSEDVQEVLGRSQLVTMVKFLSAVHGPRDAGARTKILQDTTSFMPVDSFLFILDSSGWKSVDATATTVDTFVWMDTVYGPRKKTTWLSSSSKNVCIQSELYGNSCCTFRSVNKLSVWRKKSLANCNGLESHENGS